MWLLNWRGRHIYPTVDPLNLPFFQNSSSLRSTAEAVLAIASERIKSTRIVTQSWNDSFPRHEIFFFFIPCENWKQWPSIHFRALLIPALTLLPLTFNFLFLFFVANPWCMCNCFATFVHNKPIYPSFTQTQSSCGRLQTTRDALLWNVKVFTVFLLLHRNEVNKYKKTPEQNSIKKKKKKYKSTKTILN